MPSPSTSLATNRPDLATFYEFDLEAEKAGFVANQVMPVMDVLSAAGNFGKIPLEQLLAERDTARAPGAGYARGSWTFDPATYATQEHGAEEPVDDNQNAALQEYFASEVVSTARAYGAVLRNAEKRVADKVFNTSTWTGSALTTAITNEWDDAANATPIVDVEAAVTKVYEGSGLWADTLVINRQVFRNLRNCAEVIDRINSAGAGNPSKPSDVNTAMLAAVFDLEKIIVAGGTRNGANAGQAASPGQIWSGEYAMVCKTANGIDMSEPCIGRTFHWSQDGSSIGGSIESYRDEAVRSNVIRVRHQVAEVVLYPQAGHLLSNITT